MCRRQVRADCRAQPLLLRTESGRPARADTGSPWDKVCAIWHRPGEPAGHSPNTGRAVVGVESRLARRAGRSGKGAVETAMVAVASAPAAVKTGLVAIPSALTAVETAMAAVPSALAAVPSAGPRPRPQCLRFFPRWPRSRPQRLRFLPRWSRFLPPGRGSFRDDRGQDRGGRRMNG